MRLDLLPVLLTATLLLGACGGGGKSDDSGNPPVPQTFTVGGTATGIAGDGLTLRLNGGQDLALDVDGTFTFANRVAAGLGYNVTIQAQPAMPSQTCALSNASGSVGSTNVGNVTVTCTTSSYALGGVVDGLEGTGLVLQRNGGPDLAISDDGEFVFAEEIESGSGYSVTVSSQPANPSQTCVVIRGGGIVADAAIDDIDVACTTNSYAVEATVSGLAGSGLQLSLNSGAVVTPPTSGIFPFAGSLLSGASYSVNVTSQPVNPSQTCQVSSSAGTVGGSDVNVSVTCETERFAVGGTVSGLTGAGLVLQLNGTQDLPVNSDGAFAFTLPIDSGAAYAVTVKDQTSAFRELCIARDASGQVGGSAVTSVTVECSVLLGYVYVATGADGVLRTYGIQPNGALSRVPSTVSLGTSPREMIVAPNGRALYAVNSASNTLSAVAVDPDRGGLTSLGEVSIGGEPSGAMDLAIDPSGRFIYATNQLARTVTRVSVDAVTGALTNEGVAVTAAAGTDTVNVAITPDGAYLYVLAVDEGTSQSLTAYSVDPTTGALTAGASIDPGVVDGDLAMDALGRTLYLRSIQMPYLDMYDTTVLPYAIDSGTGALTPVGSGINVWGNASHFVLDPTGNYAYLLTAHGFPFTPSYQINAFTIDQTTGALFLIGGYSEFYSSAWRMAFHPSGRFLYVGSYTSLINRPASTWYDVLGYEIGAPGILPGQLAPGGVGTSSIGPGTNVLSVIAVVD